MPSCRPQREAGFTLVELVIVIVLLGIVSAYALISNSSASVYTLLSQSQTLASDLRHAQALATTWGKSLRVSVEAGGANAYRVDCVTTGPAPCNNSPVIDPATGAPFRVTVKQNVVLSGPAQLDIDSLGKPGAGASYVLSVDSASKTVTIAALTGFVTLP